MPILFLQSVGTQFPFRTTWGCNVIITESIRELKITETPQNNDIIGLKSINNRAARAKRILPHIFAVLCVMTT